MQVKDTERSSYVKIKILHLINIFGTCCPQVDNGPNNMFKYARRWIKVLLGVVQVVITNFAEDRMKTMEKKKFPFFHRKFLQISSKFHGKSTIFS